MLKVWHVYPSRYLHTKILRRSKATEGEGHTTRAPTASCVATSLTPYFDSPRLIGLRKICFP